MRTFSVSGGILAFTLSLLVFSMYVGQTNGYVYGRNLSNSTWNSNSTSNSTTNSTTTGGSTTGGGHIPTPLPCHVDPKAVPFVKSAAPFERVTNVVTIHGNNFGCSTSRVSAKIGRFPCHPLTFLSSSTLVCHVKGRGAELPVKVTVNGKESAHDGVFVTFVDATPSEGLTCQPPKGAENFFEPGTCTCFSGYAPSSLEAKDCDVRAACPGVVLNPRSSAQAAPFHPRVTFKNDRLYVAVLSPIVQGRKQSEINFAHPTSKERAPSTCGYPGEIWTKSVDSLDCHDVYTGELAWSSHSMCMFDQDTEQADATVDVYRSTLVYTTHEVVKSAERHFLRTQVFSYAVVVRFTRQIQKVIAVDFAPLPDESPVISVVVRDEVFRDGATGAAYVRFDTELPWPYQVSANALAGDWNSFSKEEGEVTGSAVVDTEDDESECDASRDSVCVQTWFFTVQSDTLCDVVGKFVFSNISLFCRDDSSLYACGEPTTFSLSMHSRLCQTKEVEASAQNTYSLTTFEDEELTEQQATFSVGDQAYFKLEVVDPLSTIDSITFQQVKVEGNGQVDLLYDNTTSVNEGGYFTILQELREGDDATPVAPGSPAVLTFSVLMTRALSSLQATTVDTVQNLDIEVTVEIVNHGNRYTQKRSLALRQTPNVKPSAFGVQHVTIQIVGASGQDYDEVSNKVESGMWNFGANEDEEVGWGNSATKAAQHAAFVFVASLLALCFF